jgi:hypothetical protein
MTTQDFIEKALRGTTRTTHFASVMASKDYMTGQVTVYSYGYHYPLVTIIDGNAYVNDKGYSSSTAKHIAWAYRAARNIVGASHVYSAPIFGRGEQLTPDSIKANATYEYNRLTAEMASKKRKNTIVYQSLQDKANSMLATMQAVA